MEKQKPEFDKIFEDIFEVLQNPDFLICEPFDSEREDEQRQKHRKDETLTQERIMPAIVKRLKPARKHDRVTKAVKAGNIGLVLLGDDFLAKAADLMGRGSVVPELQPVEG